MMGCFVVSASRKISDFLHGWLLEVAISSDARKEAALNSFFHSDFDPAVLDDQRARREQSRRNRGEASSSGLKDPKDEPAEEMTLDLENRRYNFFFTLLGATFRLLFG